MRGWLLVLLLAVVALLVVPGESWAAEGGGPRNMFARALGLGIWTLVVFLLLLYFLSKLAWKPMLEGLDKREKAIAEAMEDAKQAKAKANQLEARFEAEMKKAAEQARGVVEKANRDAQRLVDEMTAKAKAEIQVERDRLYRDLAVAKDNALNEMWQQAATLATTVSAKAIRRQLTPEDHRNLVEEALAEMGGAIESGRAFVRTGKT